MQGEEAITSSAMWYAASSIQARPLHLHSHTFINISGAYMWCMQWCIQEVEIMAERSKRMSVTIEPLTEEKFYTHAKDKESMGAFLNRCTQERFTRRRKRATN